MDNVSFDFEAASHSLELLSLHLLHAEIIPVYHQVPFFVFKDKGFSL